MLAIFRLYMRKLSISYTNVCGELQFVGWGGCEISHPPHPTPQIVKLPTHM